MTEYTLAQFSQLLGSTATLEQNSDGHYIFSSDSPPRSIYGDNTLKIQEGETLIMNGFLSCDGGALLNEGTIILNNNFEIIQGKSGDPEAFINKGTIHINDNGGKITILDDYFTSRDSSIINNNGTIELTGGDLLTYDSSTINNNGTIEITGGNRLLTYDSITINNNGTIQLTGKNSSTGQVSSVGTVNSSTINNNGTIEVTDGTILLTRDSSTINNNGTIEVTGQNSSTGSGSSVGTYDSSTINNNTGGEIDNSSIINVQENSIFNNYSSIKNNSSGIITLGLDCEFYNFGLYGQGGIINNLGSIEQGGNFTGVRTNLYNCGGSIEGGGIINYITLANCPSDKVINENILHNGWNNIGSDLPHNDLYLEEGSNATIVAAYYFDNNIKSYIHLEASSDGSIPNVNNIIALSQLQLPLMNVGLWIKVDVPGDSNSVLYSFTTEDNEGQDLNNTSTNRTSNRTTIKTNSKTNSKKRNNVLNFTY
jgi:hypothetical protein